MTQGIPESDWKIFHSLHEVTLSRFCDLVLAEVAEISGDAKLSSHQRYLKIFRRVDELNNELAALFNSESRSRAMMQLASRAKRKLLTDEELARFSPATKEMIARWLEF